VQCEAATQTAYAPAAGGPPVGMGAKRQRPPAAAASLADSVFDPFSRFHGQAPPYSVRLKFSVTRRDGIRTSD
jgi:hypothetical protein